MQSQAGSTKMGNQLAEAESLLQKQDLLQTQVSALGETIGIISSTAAKVEQQETERKRVALVPTPLSLSQVKVGDVHHIQSKVRALDTQYKSLVSLCSSRSSSLHSASKHRDTRGTLPPCLSSWAAVFSGGSSWRLSSGCLSSSMTVRSWRPGSMSAG